MSSEKAAVEALLAKSPYSASSKSALESYVTAQASGAAPYYMDANRSLLKLYQFSPQSTNDEKVALVLLLALLEFPGTDFLALRYLVPERLQKSEPIAAIINCASLLDKCKFAEFWTAFKTIEGNDAVKALTEQSTEKAQRTIIGALALSYRTASVAKVLAASSMSSGDAVSQLNHACVESVSGDKVVFVASGDNTKRNRVFQEGVNFSSIASMMSKVSSE